MKEQAQEFVDIVAILGPCLVGFIMTGLYVAERREKRTIIAKLEALQNLILRKAGLGD